MKLVKNILVIFLISFVLLELALAVLVYFTQPKIELPTYSFDNTQSFWFDLSEDFGTWHLPNHQYRQKKTCFDVLYQSNEYGFRDKERAKKSSKNRVLVLGDSFMEGVGVELENRFSNLLEKETRTPHLNFGMAGNFGPTQYALLYEKLASKFDHDAIIIAVLPANDFIDDDLAINLTFGSNRYKPYWKGEFPSYELVYHQDSIHKSSVNQFDQKLLKKLLKNFTYSYNYLLYVKTKWRGNKALESTHKNLSDVPDYFTYSHQQLNRLKHSLLYLKKQAKNKKVMLVTIPTEKELLKFQKTNSNPLGKELRLFSKQYNFDYLDLLEESKSLKKEEMSELFFHCDGHWSKKGNLFAKKKALEKLNYYR